MTKYMRDWYLIQRLNEREFTEGKKGVDRLVSHDYMGAAEFEWGAIPASWRKLRELAAQQKLVKFETPFLSSREKPFYVIASVDDTDVLEALEAAFNNELQTKESTYMDEWHPSVDNPSKYKLEAIAWLKVSDKNRNHNPLVWCVYKTLANALFAELHRQTVAPVSTAPTQEETPQSAIELNDIEMGNTVCFVSKNQTLKGFVLSFVDGQHAVNVRVDGGRKLTVGINSIKEILK